MYLFLSIYKDKQDPHKPKTQTLIDLKVQDTKQQEQTMWSHLVTVVLCILSLTSPLAHSRSLTLSDPHRKPETTVLDVASSIRNAKSLLTYSSTVTKPTPHFNQQKLKPINSAHQLTMQLQSRGCIEKVAHTDYESLTRARLQRDSARVRFITSRVEVAVNGIVSSGSELGFEQGKRVQGPVVSGTSEGSGEYFSRVGLGNPPSPVYLMLDTGSDVNWVQCEPCARCYQQVDPVFNPSLSSSYRQLGCNSSQCKSLDVSECQKGTCLYQVSYGDGSYTVGELVTETVTFGSASVHNIAIGCGHNNDGLFIGADGLLGLGGGSLSFPSQVNATSFSYCLVDRDSDSTSTLEFNTTLPPNAITSTLLRNRMVDTFYYLELTGISVGGELLTFPKSAFQIDQTGNGGIIIDSGTAVTRLQTQVYYSLRDKFTQGTKNLQPVNGVELFDTCYNLSTRDSVEVPSVSFHFNNGNQLRLPAKNYLIPVDARGTFCFAFAPTASGLSILGNVQQQQMRVVFDIANSLVGFVPGDC